MALFDFILESSSICVSLAGTTTICVSLSCFDMDEISLLSVVVVQGISKGVVVESLLSSMVRGGKAPDFVLCIGDDRSDEDMFESIVCPANGSVKLPATSEVFACTVGKKPSMAKYYLDDTVDVIKMLQGLASAPSQHRPWPVQLRVTFEEGNGV